GKSRVWVLLFIIRIVTLFAPFLKMFAILLLSTIPLSVIYYPNINMSKFKKIFFTVVVIVLTCVAIVFWALKPLL
ncbi:MAG: hypothetical protein K2G88_02880, partial [Oscillospiraceae bacterium]|nr:hypothetical protein [Oscillospiraceae bacterium]